VRRNATVAGRRRGKTPRAWHRTPPGAIRSGTQLSLSMKPSWERRHLCRRRGRALAPTEPRLCAAGMATAKSCAVTVAIPVWQDRVSPVFDAASRLLVVRQQRGREVGRKEFVLGALSSEALARSVAELRVDVLLCAAISEPLRLVLERGGVRVETHLCGEVEALLHAFRAGDCRRAEFRMPGCWDPHGDEIPPRRAAAAGGAHSRRARRIR